jgi:hypothetical protein
VRDRGVGSACQPVYGTEQISGEAVDGLWWPWWCILSIRHLHAHMLPLLVSLLACSLSVLPAAFIFLNIDSQTAPAGPVPTHARKHTASSSPSHSALLKRVPALRLFSSSTVVKLMPRYLSRPIWFGSSSLRRSSSLRFVSSFVPLAADPPLRRAPAAAEFLAPTPEKVPLLSSPLHFAPSYRVLPL